MKKRADFWHPKVLILSADVYNVDIIVIVNMPSKEALRKLKGKVPAKELVALKGMTEEWDKDIESGVVEGRMFQLKGGFVVFVNLDRHKFRKSVGTLVHELSHVTHYLLLNRQIALSQETDEAYAYLMEHLTVQALRKLYS